MFRLPAVVFAVALSAAVHPASGVLNAEERGASAMAAAAPVAILVDTSQAVRPHVSDIRRALQSFVKDLQGTREIAIIEFGERTSVLTDYTMDPIQLQNGVNKVFSRTGSGAYVLDAIVETSRELRTRDAVQPIIVVITAEGPEFSDRYHEAVLDELRTTEATLHAFVLSSNASAGLRDVAAREREFALARGTKATGGRREHLLTSMALEARLMDLAAALKQS